MSSAYLGPIDMNRPSPQANGKPVVSVVVATYNRARFLAETVQSALSQSIQSIEILVINDASTDSTETVARRLESQDPRVRLINLPRNSGPSHARNVGLDTAVGDYVAILDADDICMPNRFERQIAFLASSKADLCGSWFVEFGRGMTRTVRWPHSVPALRAAMLFQSTICHPTVMARRQVFDLLRYRPELRLAEDYDLFARAMTNFRLANVPEVLTRYRRHSDQTTLKERAAMEEITRHIRIEALQSTGIKASPEEQRIHNLIRAPQSNRSMEDFERIEAWLLKLIDHFDHREAKHVIASQWTRAAVRAAPMGWPMWRKYRASPLHGLLDGKTGGDIDLAILAAIRLDYGSPAFEALRRFGLSA